MRLFRIVEIAVFGLLSLQRSTSSEASSEAYSEASSPNFLYLCVQGFTNSELIARLRL